MSILFSLTGHSLVRLSLRLDGGKVSEEGMQTAEFPDSLAPRFLHCHLHIIFLFLAPFPHAVFLNLKSMWEEGNVEHPCIVSSVPAMYIDMPYYFI